jgi:hypothetical protein
VKDGMVRDGNLLAVGNKGVHSEVGRERIRKRKCIFVLKWKQNTAVLR